MRHALLLAVVLLGSGCAYRYIYSVQDTPVPVEDGRPSSIVNVAEYRSFLFFSRIKDVWYECRSPEPGVLDCVKRCDVRDEDGRLVSCSVIRAL